MKKFIVCATILLDHYFQCIRQEALHVAFFQSFHVLYYILLPCNIVLSCNDFCLSCCIYLYQEEEDKMRTKNNCYVKNIKKKREGEKDQNCSVENI